MTIQVKSSRGFRTVLLAAVLMLGPASHGLVYDLYAAENEQPQLVQGAPDRYVVKEGDSLWGIARKFLVNPWTWPKIWQSNPGIENPHLIFPGDVLILSESDGSSAPQVKVLRKRKVSKLSPTIRAEPLEAAVPTLSPDIILPFLRKPLIIERGELDGAPYVAVGEEGAIAMGKYSVFFGRGFDQKKNRVKTGDLFHVFRPGKLLIHPLTNESLGIQALHLGMARVIEPGSTSKLEIILAHEDIGPGDRMVAQKEQISLPYFQPRAPERKVTGIIVDAPDAVAELSRLSMVVLTLGERDGIEAGHVLRILRKEPLRKDPVTGKLFQPPPQSSGLTMVFRTFEKVSYALVMTSNRVIHIGDIVESP
jgi:hypothetical protein